MVDREGSPRGPPGITPSSGGRSGLVVGLLGLAALLRLLRVLLRWDEIALAYGAYQAPLVEDLGSPWRLVNDFVGLHPPLYGVIYAAIERVAPIPLLVLGFSGLCSWVAVLLVHRAARWLWGEGPALVALALAATAPVALHYAAEVNDYPLLLALLAGVWLAWARHRAGVGGWVAVALAGLAAAWAHFLGGAVAGLVALAVLVRQPRDGLRILAVLALGAAPLVAGALRLAGDHHTFGQPVIRPLQSLVDWRVRFGGWVLPGLLLGLPGLRGAPAVAFGWAGTVVTILVMVALGVAAPHQFPYWSLLMPAGVLLVAAGSRRRPWVALAALALAAAQALLGLRDGGRALVEVARDQSRIRAVDVALAEAGPGDALWLVSPALQPDDDKWATSSVLWRLRPWVPQPMTWPFPLDYTDYRLGQPRRYRDLTVYTFTDFWPDRMDAILGHHTGLGSRIWIALYDHGPADRYPQRLHQVLQPWAWSERVVGTDVGLGTDRLVVVEGPRAGLAERFGGEVAP